MIGSRGIGILVLALAFGLAFAPLASATVGGPSDGEASADHAPAADEPAVAGSSANGSADSAISTFVQSSSADTEATVDAELFESAFESADEDARADVVTNRIERLEERLASLEAEREELEAERENLSETVYDARMTRFTVQLAALDDAVTVADERADEEGVDRSAVAELRSNASDLAGEEVAEIATGLAGIDPPGQSDDHPAGDGPPGQSDESPGQSDERSQTTDDGGS